MAEIFKESMDAPGDGVKVDNSGSVTLVSLHRKRAKWYDRDTLFLYLAGFRHWAYRKRAIQSLALNHGDTVVDLACGTGLNFFLLQQQAGPRGKITGVDLTDAMLDEAAGRVAAHGWSNVELVKLDVARYVFPASLDGILSTFALTLVPEFDDVIRSVLWRFCRESVSSFSTSRGRRHRS
jgi:ubiquinone/menaquinone biosynthesis C-methylase UbiE